MINYYVAHPINKFDGNIKEGETVKEAFFRNWNASYKYAVKKFMELYRARNICAFVPGIYSIPLAKTLYDEVQDDRNLWMKIDFDFMEGWNENGGLVILMSGLAYDVVDGKLKFCSSGCQAEWLWAKERDVPVYDLKWFIEGIMSDNLICYDLLI